MRKSSGTVLWRRLVRWGLALALLAGAVGVGWWAGRNSVYVDGHTESPPAPVVYTVAEDTLVRTFSYQANGKWLLTPGFPNRLAGTITKVGLSGSAATAVRAGAVLYTVDETPVVAVAGETPAFRTLENGTHGADVLQLEDFLAEKGFLRSAPDGRFDWETTAAVKVWQADLGAPQSGVLPLGSIVFLRSFPVQMVAAEALRLGAPVADGVTLFEVVADDPTMELLLGADQAGNVPPGAPVEVTMGGGIVHAAAGAQREVDGQISVALQGADGKSAPCPHPCGAVPVQGVTQFPASVTVLGPATGPVVPVAAIETDAAGATTVLDENGAKRPVKVLLQVGGQAVVSGVAVGDRVRLPSSTS